MIPRSEVYAAIDGERHYQDTLPKTRRETEVNTVAEYILMIEEYACKARREWVSKPGNEAALHQIRKLAALAVAAMELYGAPKRSEPTQEGK